MCTEEREREREEDVSTGTSLRPSVDVNRGVAGGCMCVVHVSIEIESI
jgi:hypothetical protein